MNPRSLEKLVKNMNKKLLFGMFAATTVILSACGEMNSDPLANNEEYKGMARSFNEESNVQEQKFQDFSFVNQVFPAPKTSGALVFVEGKRNSYKLNIPVLQDGIEYVIATKGLPKTAEFKKVPDSFDEYELTWTPEAGFGTNKEDYGTVKFSVNLVVTKTANKQTEELLSLMSLKHELELVVVQRPVLPEGN